MTAIWGTSFPMMKSLNLQIDQHFGESVQIASIGFRTAAAAWMIALRFSFALILFLICFPRTTGRVRWPHIGAGAAIGFMFAVGLVLQVIGLATIPASRSGFLTSLTVVFVPMLSTILRWRLPNATVLGAGAIAMVGVSVLTGLVNLEGGGVVIADDALGGWTFGDSLTIFGAVFFAFQIVLVDWFGKKYESTEFTPSMFATTAMFAWILLYVLQFVGPEDGDSLAIGRWVQLGLKPTFWGLVVVLAVFPTMVAFVLMNKYQPAISAVQAGVIYTLEPVFASAFAMFLPAILSTLCMVSYSNESFTMPLIVGGSLVAAANVLALWPIRSSFPGQDRRRLS